MNLEIPATRSVWYQTLSQADEADLVSGSGELTHATPDVLIVGGGIVGLALAYFLAEQKVRVQLIEGGRLGQGATAASAGGIWPNDQGPSHSEAFQEMAFVGRDLWGRMSLRPEFSIDWRVNGFLNVNEQRFGPSAVETARRLQEQGYAVQAVDAEQIAALEPNLRPGLASGLHLPSEAHLNPLKAVASLARAARRHGAGINPGVTAGGVHLNGQRVTSITTSAGVIEPAKVVACTGWSGLFVGGLADPWPIRPVSGQMISTDPLPPLLRSSVAGEFLVFQLKSGEIVTGGNLLESESQSPDPALSERFAAAARELVPALAGVRFTRSWCGLRPATRDGLPLIDRANAAENLWIAGGHFRNGLLLAPATAKWLAEWIVTGAAPEALVPFRSQRLASQ